MENLKHIQKIKKNINDLRDLRKDTITSDELNEEQLYYLQEGFREGLCAAAMYLADELDGELGEGSYLENEEKWWHYHNDEEGDIGTDERLNIF